MIESILTNIVGLTGMVGTVLMALVGYLGKRYLVPYLLFAKRRAYAEWIAIIADEVTDDLKQRYPTNSWLGHLDDAVDKLMDLCDIDKVVARRAVNAAAGRKGK